MALLKLGLYEAANVDASVALTLDPTYTKAYLRRAIARRELADLEGALRDCEKALQLEPKNKQAKEELEKTKLKQAESEGNDPEEPEAGANDTQVSDSESLYESGTKCESPTDLDSPGADYESFSAPGSFDHGESLSESESSSIEDSDLNDLQCCRAAVCDAGGSGVPSSISSPISGPPVSPGLKDMADKLAEFFRSPALDKNDYADFFLMYLGEDMDVRLPQGKIRGYQNLLVRPCDVILHCLHNLLEAIKLRRPGYTERDMAAYINWFLTHEEGYISGSIATIATSEPYLGKVIPGDFPDFIEPESNLLTRCAPRHREDSEAPTCLGLQRTPDSNSGSTLVVSGAPSFSGRLNVSALCLTLVLFSSLLALFLAFNLHLQRLC